ncbi:MAG: PaaI family thioesterase [Caldilineaceae bacterium]|nr:PaaI family thioesterase [Caldilineaceae bacterium]
MQPPVAENAPAAANPELHKQLAARMQSGLSAHLGIELVAVRPGYLCAQLEIAPHHIAANGYLHGGSVVALADTACGFGCFASLPEDANNFTTIELKSNFLRTTTAGVLRAEAHLVHGGRRTQVWDATVFDAQARALALFRCTQMILYPDKSPK